jgi:hypothetical protein
MTAIRAFTERSLLGILAFAGCMAASAQEPKLIFVFEKDTMSPVAKLTDEGISALDRLPPEEQQQYVARYFTPGLPYRFYGQKGARGTAKAAGPPINAGCISYLGKVDTGFPNEQAGVLTNYPLGPQGTGRSTTPNREQIAEAQRLARGFLLKKGVPAAHIAKILRLVNDDGSSMPQIIWALPAHGKTAAMLVASYRFDDYASDNASDSHLYSLTMIAEAGPSRRYTPVYVDYIETANEAEVETNAFVTAFDLDGDGQDEVILNSSGYESFQYQIIVKRHGKWEKRVTGGGAGC